MAGSDLARVPQRTDDAGRRWQHDRVEAGEADIDLPDGDERRDQEDGRSPAADDARVRGHGRKAFVNNEA